MDFKRQLNEDFDSYALRLYANKGLYNLNSIQIGELLNAESDIKKDESAWRKFYSAMQHGIEYQKRRDKGNICTTILSISDLHVPFQLPVEVLEDFIETVDVLQINGDVCDNQATSKFPKCYRVSPMEEIIETRQYLIDLINYIRPKKVIVNYGNHDLRFQNYLAKNLDTDILELMPKTSLELMFIDGFNHYNKRELTKVWYPPLKEVIEDIEVMYVDNWYCQIGDTIFCHPCAFSNGMMKTAEKAMLWFRNEGFDFKTLVMSHTHRSGQYTIGNTTIYEQGAFCDVRKNNYSDGMLTNSQKEGFICIYQDVKGNTIKDKTKLIVLN